MAAVGQMFFHVCTDNRIDVSIDVIRDFTPYVFAIKHHFLLLNLSSRALVIEAQLTSAS